MRAQSVLAAGVLSLALAAIGSAKTWNVIMDSPTKAGAVMLPAGNYHLKVDNNNQAIFSDSNSGKKFTVPVKVQNADHKFQQTEMQTNNQTGSPMIQAIDLGGTTEELQFGE